MKLPRDWVSLSPNGIGHQKPQHYKEMAKVAWTVKGNGRKAWKILSEGVCDGCALGVAGFHDWTLSGVHLCTTRLNLLRVNTMPALDPAVLAWENGAAVTLARTLYDQRALPGGTLDHIRLPVLADALEKAGCLDRDILGHLRGPDMMPVLLNAADRPLFLGSRPTPFPGADGYPPLLEPLL